MLSLTYKATQNSFTTKSLSCSSNRLGYQAVYSSNTRGDESDASLPDDNTPTFHFKLPFVGRYSSVTQKKNPFSYQTLW